MYKYFHVFKNSPDTINESTVSLAVAEMGDRGDRGRAKWAENWGLLCPFS